MATLTLVRPTVQTSLVGFLALDAERGSGSIVCLDPEEDEDEEDEDEDEEDEDEEDDED